MMSPEGAPSSQSNVGEGQTHGSNDARFQVRLETSLPRASIQGRSARLPLPFFPWIGGKRWLSRCFLDLIRTTAPVATYHEPFLGGGAIALALLGSRAITDAILSDLSTDVISAYHAIRDCPAEVIATELRRHRESHSRAHYCEVRDAYRPDQEIPTHTHVLAQKGAAFIYLVTGAYNGSWRVGIGGNLTINGRDEPAPSFAFASVRRATTLLRQTIIIADDFRNVRSRVDRGDLVYLDPPYIRNGTVRGHVQYGAVPFMAVEQAEVIDLARELADRGVRVALSLLATHGTSPALGSFRTIDAPEIHRRRELLAVSW